jgi:hypothetical protein
LQVPQTPWLQEEGTAAPAFLAALSTVCSAVMVKVLPERAMRTVKVS